VTAENSTTDIALPVLPKRKHSKMRWTVLIVVQILIILHVALWFIGKKYGWFGGKTLSPIEPSEGILFVAEGIVNTGAIFFALALLSTLIFGRWFCGWGCHVVLLQDWCYLLLRKIHIRPKPFRSRTLIFFPFALAFYMYIWPLLYRFLIVKKPWPEMSNQLLTEDYWGSFASPIIAVPFLFICGFATVYILGAKGFCTYGCPYGGFFKPLDAVSPMHVRVNDNCQQCGRCTAACTSNVRVHEEVKLYKMVIDSGCMKIMDCVDACPNDALHIGFGTVALGKRTQKRKYDLALWEELFVSALFLLGFFAFRRLYEFIPMLMAVGISLVVTWWVWKAIKVLQKSNVNFHSWRLKFHGKIKLPGFLFILIAVILFALTAHSAVIQSFKLIGENAIRNNDTATAMRYYKLASPFEDGGYAFASNPNIDKAVGVYLESELQFIEAERLFRRIHKRVGDEYSAMLLAQNLQNHYQFNPINTFYTDKLEANPDWDTLWEDYVGWIKRSSMYTRALDLSRVAVEKNPHATRLKVQLALLEMDHGSPSEASKIMRRVLEEDNNNPSWWLLYARALEREGKKEESRKAIQTVREIQAERARSRDLDR
jgi:polyferredoxin